MAKLLAFVEAVISSIPFFLTWWGKCWHARGVPVHRGTPRFCSDRAGACFQRCFIFFLLRPSRADMPAFAQTQMRGCELRLSAGCVLNRADHGAHSGQEIRWQCATWQGRKRMSLSRAAGRERTQTLTSAAHIVGRSSQSGSATLAFRDYTKRSREFEIDQLGSKSRYAHVSRRLPNSLEVSRFLDDRRDAPLLGGSRTTSSRALGQCTT